MTNEALTPPVDQLLPKLDGLNDHEYLEASQQFGQQWCEFTTKGVVEAASGVFSSLSDIYRTRASNYSQIPETEKAVFLIEQQREFENKLYRSRGEEPPKYGELTADLLKKGRVEVIEIASGLPAILTNDRFNKELFGNDVSNFATALLAEERDSIPFVVLVGSKDEDNPSLTQNKWHEASHIAFHTARANSLIPDNTEEGVNKFVFVAIQEEAVAQCNAQQPGVTHAGNTAWFRRLGLESVVENVRALDRFYAKTTTVIDSRDLILGIIQSRNMSELTQHFQRMSLIADKLAR
ncbi:MAG: hypothetical protein ABSB12_00105 [Candidatus Saccharimonadales bacterium]|jgi:hypothetical protein